VALDPDEPRVPDEPERGRVELRLEMDRVERLRRERRRTLRGVMQHRQDTRVGERPADHVALHPVRIHAPAADHHPARAASIEHGRELQGRVGVQVVRELVLTGRKQIRLRRRAPRGDRGEVGVQRRSIAGQRRVVDEPLRIDPVPERVTQQVVGKGGGCRPLDRGEVRAIRDAREERDQQGDRSPHPTPGSDCHEEAT
jgi:hypothetical protein